MMLAALSSSSMAHRMIMHGSVCSKALRKSGSSFDVHMHKPTNKYYVERKVFVCIKWSVFETITIIMPSNSTADKQNWTKYLPQNNETTSLRAFNILEDAIMVEVSFTAPNHIQAHKHWCQTKPSTRLRKIVGKTSVWNIIVGARRRKGQTNVKSYRETVTNNWEKKQLFSAYQVTWLLCLRFAIECQRVWRCASAYSCKWFSMRV